MSQPIPPTVPQSQKPQWPAWAIIVVTLACIVVGGWILTLLGS